MSERLLGSGCGGGEGFAGWRGPFCASGIAGFGLPGPGIFEDGCGPVSGAAIHCLPVRPRGWTSGKVDGSEFANDTLAYGYTGVWIHWRMPARSGNPRNISG